MRDREERERERETERDFWLKSYYRQTSLQNSLIRVQFLHNIALSSVFYAIFWQFPTKKILLCLWGFKIYLQRCEILEERKRDRERDTEGERDFG